VRLWKWKEKNCSNLLFLLLYLCVIRLVFSWFWATYEANNIFLSVCSLWELFVLHLCDLFSCWFGPRFTHLCPKLELPPSLFLVGIIWVQGCWGLGAQMIEYKHVADIKLFNTTVYDFGSPSLGSLDHFQAFVSMSTYCLMRTRRSSLSHMVHFWKHKKAHCHSLLMCTKGCILFCCFKRCGLCNILIPNFKVLSR